MYMYFTKTYTLSPKELIDKNTGTYNKYMYPGSLTLI